MSYQDGGHISETTREVDLIRIALINEYSKIENELTIILSALARIDFATANAINFNIANFKTRCKIIGDIINIKAPDLSKSWRKIEGWLDKANTHRNKIVHWQSSRFHSPKFKNAKILLHPPKRIAEPIEFKTSYTTKDLQNLQPNFVNLRIVLSELRMILISSDLPSPKNATYSLFLNMPSGSVEDFVADLEAIGFST